MTETIKLFPGQKVRVTEYMGGFATDWMLLHRDKIDGTLTAVWLTERGSGRWNFPNDEFKPSDFGGLTFEFQDGHTPCKTVGELKAAIADLPDDMPVGKWDGCEDLMYSSINAAPRTAYLRDKQGDYESWSIYGGYDEDDPEPTRKMLVI